VIRPFWLGSCEICGSESLVADGFSFVDQIEIALSNLFNVVIRKSKLKCLTFAENVKASFDTFFFVFGFFGNPLLACQLKTHLKFNRLGQRNSHSKVQNNFIVD
jgi:hypothetical protein